MTGDLVMLEATRLSALIRARQVSCVEVMRVFLDHINRLNPLVNAMVNLRDDEELLREAARRDRELRDGVYRGWMHGMPHAVKESSQVRGMPWTCGSPVHAERMGTTDALTVARMKRAGAVIVGQTNLPEFALGCNTYNPIYGPTGNAYDPAKTAGGSSGGAGCAVALRMVPVADGDDYMGSLRNPAAFNNVLGFRPSYGRIPTPGFIAQASAAGPMARTVSDLAALLVTLAGPTGRAPLETREDPAFLAGRLEGDVAGARIAWVGDFRGHLAVEPEVLAVCEASFRIFEDIGAHVEPAVPDHDMAALWEAWLVWRGLAQLERYELWRDPAKRALMKSEARWEVERAAGYRALDVVRADAQRTAWYAAVLDLLETYDFILAPSTQVMPFDKNIQWPTSINGREMDTYHRWMEIAAPWSLTQLPVMGMPAGFGAMGLPTGVQLIGRPGADIAVLRLAQAYEQAAEWHTRLPPLLTRLAELEAPAL